MISEYNQDKRKISLTIVDDHLLFAEGLKELLNSQTEFGEILLFQNAKEAMETILLKKPDLSLIDVGLPDLNGIELTKRVIQKDPTLKILIITIDDSRETILKAFTAGARGFLLKSAPFSHILNGIFTALGGDVVIGTGVFPTVINELRNILVVKENKSISPLIQELSPRELEVLKKVCQGKNNQVIADELFISEKTVKNYITKLLDKLGIDSRMKLIVFGIQENLLQKED